MRKSGCVQTKRNSTIELLRLFFMFGIVLGHVYCHGTHLDFHWIYTMCKTPTNIWNMPLYTLGTIGVTGFMFISGYYGVNGSIDKIVHFLWITVFYGLVGMIYSGFSLRKIMLLPLSFDLWWFVSSYMVLLLISPILNKGIEMTNRKQHKLIVAGLFVYTYFLGFFNWANSRDFVLLFTIYMVARYIRLYPNNRLSFLCYHYGGGNINSIFYHTNTNGISRSELGSLYG